MKINNEGYKIIGYTLVLWCVVIGCLLHFTDLPMWANAIAIAVAAGHMIFTLAFFREPRRVPLEDDPNTVYAPADGKVVVIEEVMENEVLNQKCIQVSIFMSVTNVHINWYPISGKVSYFKYHPGRFLMAWNPKSSELNERTTTVVDNGRHRILFRQIAGYVARRVVWYTKPGQEVRQATKCGFIKFGSRVDILLPADSEILVTLNDKTTGTRTPIARLK